MGAQRTLRSPSLYGTPLPLVSVLRRHHPSYTPLHPVQVFVTPKATLTDLKDEVESVYRALYPSDQYVSYALSLMRDLLRLTHRVLYRQPKVQHLRHHRRGDMLLSYPVSRCFEDGDDVTALTDLNSENGYVRHEWRCLRSELRVGSTPAFGRRGILFNSSVWERGVGTKRKGAEMDESEDSFKRPKVDVSGVWATWVGQ